MMKSAKGSERFLSTVQVSNHISYKAISVMLTSFLLFAVVSFSVLTLIYPVPALQNLS